MRKKSQIIYSTLPYEHASRLLFKHISTLRHKMYIYYLPGKKTETIPGPIPDTHTDVITNI